LPLIVLDGPEKAGKTTIVNVLRDLYGYRVRHWGPVKSHMEFLAQLQQDLLVPGKRVVWDRSWVSELVYSGLLGRATKLNHDAWLAEFLFTRAVRVYGEVAIVRGPDPSILASLRDNTDLPVDPAVEQREFARHAANWRWSVVNNEHTAESAEHSAFRLHERAVDIERESLLKGLYVPSFAGPPDSPIWIIGERRNLNTRYGDWIPFMSSYTLRFARILGKAATRIGWTNADYLRSGLMVHKHVKLIIACGRVAEKEVSKLQDFKGQVIAIPHPAAFYRWGRYRKVRDTTEQQIVQSVARHIDSVEQSALQEFYHGSTS
jgi:hypothetical protein